MREKLDEKLDSERNWTEKLDRETGQRNWTVREKLDVYKEVEKGQLQLESERWR